MNPPIVGENCNYYSLSEHNRMGDYFIPTCWVVAVGTPKWVHSSHDFSAILAAGAAYSYGVEIVSGKHRAR